MSSGKAIEAVINQMIVYLDSKKERVRRLAANSLAQLGPSASKAITPLLSVLGDECSDVSSAAVSAIEKIAIHDESEALLIAELKVSNFYAFIGRVLARRGTRPVISALLEELKGSVPERQIAAAEALFNIESIEPITMLESKLVYMYEEFMGTEIGDRTERLLEQIEQLR